MAYNPKKVFEIVNKEYSNIGFEIREEKKDKMNFNSEITLHLKEGDFGLLVDVDIDDSSITIHFVFDKVKRDLECLNLVNDLTMTDLSWAAYIDNNDYFIIRHRYECDDEKEQANRICGYIDYVLNDEDTEELLKPILAKIIKE